MGVVRPRNLRIGSIRLEHLENNLEFNLWAIATITHGNKEIDFGSQEN